MKQSGAAAVYKPQGTTDQGHQGTCNLQKLTLMLSGAKCCHQVINEIHFFQSVNNASSEDTYIVNCI